MSVDWDERFIAAIQVNHPDLEIDFSARDDKVGDDSRLLNQLLHRQRRGRRLRVWNNQKHIIVSRRFQKLPGFETARLWAEMRGWPVAVRQSGGTAVVHRPGILNLSLITVGRDRCAIDDGFDRLCAIVIQSAAELDVALQVGRVVAAYCSGSHDIHWRGRKLGGTAAIARRHRGWNGTVFHACITLQGDVETDLEVITGFEQRLGLAVNYGLADHCSLANACETTAQFINRSAGRQGLSCLGEQPNFSL